MYANKILSFNSTFGISGEFCVQRCKNGEVILTLIFKGPSSEPLISFGYSWLLLDLVQRMSGFPYPFSKAYWNPILFFYLLFLHCVVGLIQNLPFSWALCHIILYSHEHISNSMLIKLAFIYRTFWTIPRLECYIVMWELLCAHALVTLKVSNWYKLLAGKYFNP